MIKILDEKIYQLEKLGIKPSVVLCGDKMIEEIKNNMWVNLTHNHSKSSIAITTIHKGDYTLDIIRVDDENCCEVFGKEMIL